MAGRFRCAAPEMDKMRRIAHEKTRLHSQIGNGALPIFLCNPMTGRRRIPGGHHGGNGRIAGTIA